MRSWESQDGGREGRMTRRDGVGGKPTEARLTLTARAARVRPCTMSWHLTGLTNAASNLQPLARRYNAQGAVDDKIRVQPNSRW